MMGLFNLLPCCGPRKGKGKAAESSSPHTTESTTLLNPSRTNSFVSSSDTQRAGSHGGIGMYGGTAGGDRLTEAQKMKIESIGREAGGYMLPIQSVGPRSYLSVSRTSTSNGPLSLSLAHLPEPPSASASTTSPSTSTQSSRAATPLIGHAPLAGETGLLSPKSKGYQTSPGTGGEKETVLAPKGDDEGVIRKTLFVGLDGTPMALGGGRKISGGNVKRKKGKGKGTK